MPTGIYKRKPFTEEHKKNIAKGHKGLKHTEESKKKMRESIAKYDNRYKFPKKNKIWLGISGKNHPRYGKKMSEETKKKISESKKGQCAGKNHFAWMGENANYRSIHSWVVRKKGKAIKCEHCDKTGTGHEIHWANIDHKYRRNINDYISLCVKCHGEYDKKNNLRKHI